MVLTTGSVEQIPPSFWRWPHIDAAKEWADHKSGRLAVDTEFMDRFEALRVACGFPLPIVSGYRTPEHNVEVSTTGETGPHTTGRAVDIRIYGPRAVVLIEQALRLGFTGIGVKQHGPFEGRFVHLDTLAAPEYPRPNLWSY